MSGAVFVFLFLRGRCLTVLTLGSTHDNALIAICIHHGIMALSESTSPVMRFAGKAIGSHAVHGDHAAAPTRYGITPAWPLVAGSRRRNRLATKRLAGVGIERQCRSPGARNSKRRLRLIRQSVCPSSLQLRQPDRSGSSSANGAAAAPASV